LVLAVLALVGLRDTASAQTWKEFRYPGDGFAITAPADPKRETGKESQSPAGPVKSNSYAFFPKAGTVFMVNVSRANPADPRSDMQLLAFSAPTGAQQVTQSGLKGRQYGFTKDGATTLIRLFAVEHVMYQLIAVTPEKEYPHPDMQRWMDSWKYLSPGK
jgi:hypothetical protein